MLPDSGKSWKIPKNLARFLPRERSYQATPQKSLLDSEKYRQKQNYIRPRKFSTRKEVSEEKSGIPKILTGTENFLRYSDKPQRKYGSTLDSEIRISSKIDKF